MESERFRSLDIPYLPVDSPELPTPAAFKLPLYPHQRRALHRLCSIERDEKFLAEGFKGKNLGTFLDYRVLGGCLCEPVGMGKSAEMLALMVSEERDKTKGPNLLLAPTHLVGQWAREAEKFCKEGEIRVITGLQNYQDIVRDDPLSVDNRTLVVVDAHSVVMSRRYHYDFRRLFKEEKGKEVRLTPEQVEMYRKKAVFISPGYSGTMYGHGGPKEQALFFPHLVLGNGRQGFRRVIFDEIQDLVEEGKEEKDCLLQLTQYTQNVWLVTATPFPAAGKSVYANHQLLGFRRLRVFCESTDPLPKSAPFEIIKRKLYIRSPEYVKQDAIQVKYEVKMVNFRLTAIENVLYRTLFRKASMAIEDDVPLWHEHYLPVRTALSHFGASESIRLELREAKRHASGGFYTHKPTAHQLAFNFNGGIMGLAQKLLEKRRTDIVLVKKDIESLDDNHFAAIENSILFGQFLVDKMREENCSKKLHKDKYWIQNQCQRIGVVPFRLGPKPEKFVESQEEVALFVEKQLMDVERAKEFLRSSKAVLLRRKEKLAKLQKNLPKLQDDVNNLGALLEDARNNTVPKYGTKIDQLLKLLQKIPVEDQVVVFCSFKDVLNIIQAVFSRERISSIALVGNAEKKSQAINTFVTKQARILLASLEESASGTNLQVAKHVVFVDTPGVSDTQAAAQVIQAIGRVVRMGQTSNVSVQYLIANDTVEVMLAKDLLRAMEGLRSVDDRSGYVCEKRGEEIGDVGISSSASTLVYEGIEVIQQQSLEDRLLQALQQAQEKGDVLDLADDEGDAPSSQETVASATSSSPVVIGKRAVPSSSSSTSFCSSSSTMLPPTGNTVDAGLVNGVKIKQERTAHFDQADMQQASGTKRVKVVDLVD